MRSLARSTRWTVLTLLGLVAAGLAQPPARAQDLKKDVKDHDGTVTIQLPGSFSATKPEMVPAERVGEWVGRFFIDDAEHNDTLVTIDRLNEFQRGTLAFSVLDATDEPVDGSVRAGDGFHEHAARKNEGPFRLRFTRYVESENGLYRVAVRTVLRDYDQAAEKIPPALDTFKVLRKAEPQKLEDGFVEHKFKGFTVYSDHDDKAVVKEAVGFFEDGWKMLDKVLDGKPFVDGDLELRVYKASGMYERAVARVYSTQVGEFAQYIGNENVLYMNSQAGFDAFPSSVRSTAAAVRLQRHVGGMAPVWLRIGLSWYANQAAIGGKPGKVDRKQLEAAKEHLAAARSLEQWIKGTVEETSDGQRNGYELWAWTHYLLHGKAPKDARKAFEQYLAVLNLTGDAKAAAETWNEVDFGKLHESFLKWTEKWK